MTLVTLRSPYEFEVLSGWQHLAVWMPGRSSWYGDGTPAPDDLHAKLTERARRERRSDAQNRPDRRVDDVLAQLMDSDAEILDYVE